MHVPVPGQPHPDVAILVGAIRMLKMGENLTFEQAAGAISCDNPEIVRRRMFAARRIALRDYGINIVAMHGIGWHRETDSETVARASGRSIRGLHRRCRKIGNEIAAVEVAPLDEQQRTEYFATRTINNLVFQATTFKTRERALAAAKTAQAITPMAEALKLMG